MSGAPEVSPVETRHSRRDRLSDTPRRRRSGFARSRIVATMKYVLPGLAFAILVLVAVWPRLHPDTDRFNFEISAVGPAGGSKPQVLNPRLQGVDSAKRPFQVTADLGAHGLDSMGGEVYDLTNPTADIVLRDGSWIALNADDGKFEAASNILHLTGKVTLFHDQGYEFQTTNAQVHLEDSAASGDDPVSGQGPFGILKANGFRLFNSGDRILFLGPAKLTVLEGKPPL